MARTITARYGGRCRKCSGRIQAGEIIVFAGKNASYHPDCYNGTETKKSSTAETKDTFVVEWPTLREELRNGFSGNYSAKIAANRNAQRDIFDSTHDRWHGYSQAQSKDWIENGYDSDPRITLEDFAPPIREKRKFIYSDEGDEIDLSAAWSGEDNFMGQWTKRETIPGVAIEFQICFSGGTSASVISAYMQWIAQAVFAIESAGIDPEISIDFINTYPWTGGRRNGNAVHTLVRVKKENEAVDLNSWSAMLSPASYRTCGFFAWTMYAESVGQPINSGMGHGFQGNAWKVFYDSDHEVIRTECPYMPRDFDADVMTAQLREAIDALRGKTN
jgi:hypothetical protein